MRTRYSVPGTPGPRTLDPDPGTKDPGRSNQDLIQQLVRQLVYAMFVTSNCALFRKKLFSIKKIVVDEIFFYKNFFCLVEV